MGESPDRRRGQAAAGTPYANLDTESLQTRQQTEALRPAGAGTDHNGEKHRDTEVVSITNAKDEQELW